MSVISLDSQRSCFDVVEELIQHYIYSSFGELLKVENGSGADITTNPSLDPYVTYTSREHDKESGLYYYRARYYEPALGQFLTADVVSGLINFPMTVNSRYTYSLSDPVNRIDPTGHLSLKGIGQFVLSGFVGGVLLGGFGSVLAQAFTVNASDEFSDTDRLIYNTGLLVATSAGGGMAAGLTASQMILIGATSAVEAGFQKGNYLENFAFSFLINTATFSVFVNSGLSGPSPFTPLVELGFQGLASVTESDVTGLKLTTYALAFTMLSPNTLSGFLVPGGQSLK